jgi:hypothetical protein
MTYRPNPSGKTWNQCLGLLAEVMERWKVGAWSWQCAASNHATRGRSHWSVFAYAPHEAQVTVTFKHPEEGERSITVSKFAYPVDNLWAVQIGLDAIRLNELRGLDDVQRQFYQALPAPKKVRDPWEVLGVGPGTEPDMIDMAYRAKAKKLHPDAGGDAEAFKELQAAYEAVKGR